MQTIFSGSGRQELDVLERDASACVDPAQLTEAVGLEQLSHTRAVAAQGIPRVDDGAVHQEAGPRSSVGAVGQDPHGGGDYLAPRITSAGMAPAIPWGRSSVG